MRTPEVYMTEFSNLKKLELFKNTVRILELAENTKFYQLPCISKISLIQRSKHPYSNTIYWTQDLDLLLLINTEEKTLINYIIQTMLQSDLIIIVKSLGEYYLLGSNHGINITSAIFHYDNENSIWEIKIGNAQEEYPMQEVPLNLFKKLINE